MKLESVLKWLEEKQEGQQALLPESAKINLEQEVDKTLEKEVNKISNKFQPAD